MKKLLNQAIPIILGIIMLAGTAGHVFRPYEYAGMIPDFIPVITANFLAAVAEFVVGIVLLVPRFRKFGGLGFLVLMIAFLPIHIWDLLREDPYVTSTPGAYFRLVIQFVFIYSGWWIYKQNATQPSARSIPQEQQ